MAMKRYTNVDEYITGHPEWEEGLVIMRNLLSATVLDEGVKWGAPIYTWNNKNVVGIAAFKNYVGLWFHQGALLNDPHQKLINAQEGKTKALRQWRFSSVEELKQNTAILQLYVEEAILNQQQGREIKAERKKPLVIPAELQAALETDRKLQDQFATFSPGKQREFAEYISEAKREETRVKRLDKITPMILEGIGLNDRYR